MTYRIPLWILLGALFPLSTLTAQDKPTTWWFKFTPSVKKGSPGEIFHVKGATNLPDQAILTADIFDNTIDGDHLIFSYKGQVNAGAFDFDLPLTFRKTIFPGRYIFQLSFDPTQQYEGVIRKLGERPKRIEQEQPLSIGDAKDHKMAIQAVKDEVGRQIKAYRTLFDRINKHFDTMTRRFDATAWEKELTRDRNELQKLTRAYNQPVEYHLAGVQSIATGIHEDLFMTLIQLLRLCDGGLHLKKKDPRQSTAMVALRNRFEKLYHTYNRSLGFGYANPSDIRAGVARLRSKLDAIVSWIDAYIRKDPAHTPADWDKNFSDLDAWTTDQTLTMMSYAPDSLAMMFSDIAIGLVGLAHRYEALIEQGHRVRPADVLNLENSTRKALQTIQDALNADH